MATNVEKKLESPAVYVGTYAKYNAGNLFGEWVELDKFSNPDELFSYLRELHKDEKYPEFMFQDFEYFPKSWYSESGCFWNDIYKWLELDENEREIVKEYIEEVDENETDFQMILDSFLCEAMDDYDFGYYLVHDLNSICMNIPNHLEYYFDYARYGRDCKMDFRETSNFIFSL